MSQHMNNELAPSSPSSIASSNPPIFTPHRSAPGSPQSAHDETEQGRQINAVINLLENLDYGLGYWIDEHITPDVPRLWGAATNLEVAIDDTEAILYELAELSDADDSVEDPDEELQHLLVELNSLIESIEHQKNELELPRNRLATAFNRTLDALRNLASSLRPTEH